MNKENKIPTVEEFLQQEKYYAVTSGDEYEIQQAMIDFAKLHVKAALENAADTADWIDDVPYHPEYGGTINRDEIRECYPENLIK